MEGFCYTKVATKSLSLGDVGSQADNFGFICMFSSFDLNACEISAATQRLEIGEKPIFASYFGYLTLKKNHNVKVIRTEQRNYCLKQQKEFRLMLNF